MYTLRYYCQGLGDKEILKLLQQVKDKHQISHEVMDLSTNGRYDQQKQKAIYEKDFKPRAKALKKATGKRITELRSHSGNYFVSKPETIGLLKNGQMIWWTHVEKNIKEFLQNLLQTGRLPI